MKKFSIVTMFSLLFFTYAPVSAQYIPDSNFAAIISGTCPTCIDSNHYLTANAQTLTSLTIGYVDYVHDLTGLDGFTNMQKINFWNQNILVFPALPPNIDTVILEWDHLTSLPALPSSLRYLDCYVNNITDLPALPPSLTFLQCGRNLLTSLPTLPSSLQTLSCGENQISSLPVLPANLTTLDVRINPLGSLPSLPSSLLYLGCDNDSLAALPTLPDSLQVLYAWGNQLTSLPELPGSLLELGCDGNFLTSLPPLNSGLKSLSCGWNPLTHLPSLPASLRELYAQHCGLIDLPPLPDTLSELNLSGNLLTSLDHIPCMEWFLDIRYNPISCLPLIPDCIPDILLEGTNVTCLPNIPNGFGNYNYLPLCEVGNVNGCYENPTITGNVYFDLNSNSLQDSGEYYASTIIVQANPGNYVGISDSSGNYKIAVPFNTTDTVGVASLSDYYVPPPTLYVVSFDTSSGQLSLNNDFGIFASSSGPDLQVTMSSPHFIPGFNSNIFLTVRNVGTVDLAGEGILTFDPSLTFVSADQGGNTTGNVVTWDFNGLHPLQAKTFTATVNCPSNVAIGTILNNSVSGMVNGATDNDLANNSQSISSTVVGSFDPNDKEVNDATLTPDELANGKYLEYTIHFQNTGTAPATFINVIDTLSDKLDASTFEMIAASHIYDITLANDLTKANHPVFVKWLFNNIQLPDSSVDFANSQGFVKFRIRPKNDLLIGDQIQNIAEIYFDFNEPMLTNTAITDVALTEGITNLNDDFFRATVYPNPASDITTLHFDHVTSTQLFLQITDELGSVIMEKIISSPHESFDLNLDLKKFHSGIYVISVKSSNDLHVIKLIKGQE